MTRPFAIDVGWAALLDPLGIDPNDPYGRLISQPFTEAGLELKHSMRGRFAQTVVSLVRHGLGVAVIDEFSVAEVYMPGVVRKPLEQHIPISTFVVRKKGRVLSNFAEFGIQQFRKPDLKFSLFLFHC